MKRILWALVAILIVAGPTPVKADMVLDWNNVALEAIKKGSTTPPMASRALAMSHAAIFDAVNSIYNTYTPYNPKNKLPGYTGASAEAAVVAAGYYTLSELFPTQLPTLQNHYHTSMAGIADGSAKTLGTELGKQVAEAMVASRAKDRWNAIYQYSPTDPPVPGRWQPTPPNYAPFLLPQWGDVTPFTMTSGSQFRPVGPPALDSSEYAAALNEVKELGAINSSKRTADETEIAHFWSDGAGTVTPPGHWNTIAQTVAQSEHNDLAENARLFALLNLALADAGISCWDQKRAFDLWRPITAIQNADKDGNDATAADPAWEPLLTTPNFASYTSGHSTFSGAASTLLAEFFGEDNIAFPSTSDGLPGVERDYESFSEAAAEAGRSRIYGGIHFEFDNVFGLASGRDLGEYVFANFLTPVPLPGTLALGLTGLSAMLLARKRRR